jgi:multicomponent Na+:H+ antiporter subunit A
MSEGPASGSRQSFHMAGIAAVVTAAIAFVATLAVWLRGGGGFDTAWLPSWDARLAFRLDGLGALYALLATGVGIAVFTYATAYLPRHLEHGGRPQAEGRRFHALMVLFMVAMVGLATAQDLLLLFVFWDLTAITSYFLIGFDRQHREARLSALMALLVTGVSAVLLLIGILILRAEFGATSIPVLLGRVGQGGPIVTLAGALIAVGALAKSAQAPLHFWLPRAMAAPTPVSAYLHSAAMVAAGVFLLSRLHPLLASTELLLDALLVVGLGSMAVGGLLALGADHLKRLLAYSTIAQYGYVVTMLGVGGAAGAAAACFYVLAHALAKSALFMTSGAVTEATGAKHLSEVGGLARAMPALAVGSGLAAAGLAALPLTIGFFKDELFFKAAAERGPWLAVAAVSSAALTFAYITRFWTGIFLGQGRPARPVPRRLVAPVVVLGGLVVAGGVLVEPFASLSRAAAEVTAAAPVAVDPAYHLDLRAENVMALATYAAGLALVLARPRLGGALAAVGRLGQRAGSERVYIGGLAALNRLSNAIHDIEVRDLRARVVAVLVPAGVLVGIGVAITPFAGSYVVGSFSRLDLPLVAALVGCALAALIVTRLRRHLAMAVGLSGVGFSLAVAYELLGAPDVALVAVLIETLMMLLFVAVFALLPRRVLQREAAIPVTGSRRIRDPVVGVISGALVLLVVWAGFSRPVPPDATADKYLELTEQAHGSDVVTVILADFRGLDTLVEISVVFVALLGVAILLRRGKLW